MRQKTLAYARALIVELRGSDCLTLIPTAAPGSEILYGSKKYPAIDLRQRTLQMILASEEALLAACEFAGPGGKRYPWSVFTLARAALEGAVNAYWLLSPDRAQDRLLRLCALELGELKYQTDFVNRLSDKSNLDDLESRKQTLHQCIKLIAGRSDSSVSSMVSDRFREFDRLVGQPHRVNANLQDYFHGWSTCSAIIHGSGWGIRAFTKLMPMEEDGTVPMVQNEDTADLMVALAATALRHSHRVYGQLAGVDLSGRMPSPDQDFSNEEQAA